MKINLDSFNDDVQIQILPLLDVIFCILTFFILGAVGLSRQQVISLDLPQASTGEPQMREMFVVAIDPIGQISIEDKGKPQQWLAVTREQLTSQLKRYNQTHPQGLIVLHAHPLANYEKVVQVLDVLRSVGGDRVALATLPTSADELDDRNSLDRSNSSPNFPSLTPTLPGTSPDSTPGLPGSNLFPSPPSIDDGTTIPGTIPDNSETDAGSSVESIPETATPAAP